MGPTAPGIYRSNAWRGAQIGNPAALHAPGAPSSSCTPATNDCYYFGSDIVKAYTTALVANGNGGAGMTVGIVDAYYNPQTIADCNAEFSISTCSSFLTIVSQTGVNCTTTPASCPTLDAGWAQETNLDVQIVHSIAPNAQILLVATIDNDITNPNLEIGVAYARAHANVVTSSWGSGEFSGEDAFGATYYSSSPVPLLWSAGDSGTQEYPCASIYAVCVGGTRLLTTAAGLRNLESAWGGTDTEGATGGLCSEVVGAPGFQGGYNTCGSFSRNAGYRSPRG